MILLDTHVWVWWVSQTDQLTPQMMGIIQNHQMAGLGVSMISCWEVAKLVELGRLQLTLPLLEWLNHALAYPGATARFDPVHRR